jgi:DNA replication and repair protein RecF
MLIRQLGLNDFRNYESADLEFQAGPNLFTGSNGQGKTNLIEAIGFLSTLGSHRVALDAAMIRTGAAAAVIRARVEHGKQSVQLEVQINRVGQNKAQANGSALKLRELPRYVSSVLFAPEDIALVRGDPAGRRRFLDLVLILRSPRMAGVIADYDRVLKQRNSLLKSARSVTVSSAQLGTLDIWDEQLVSAGSQLIEARSSLIADLLPDLSEAYEAVAGVNQRATLEHALSILSPSADDEGTMTEPPVQEDALLGERISAQAAADAFGHALIRLRRSELARGLSLVGPHRDDLVLHLNGLPARGFASHGESWSFALALKLASAALLRRESVSGDPILILDDVFAELDVSRRNRLASAISGFEQVLITAAVLEDVPRELTAANVRIRAGQILQAGDE